MRSHYEKSVTLFELLVAVIVVSLLVLGLGSITTFSNYHVRSADRRLRLQNDLAYILRHMTNEITKAVGNPGQPAVDTGGISGDAAVRVWIDYNQDGRRDSYPADRQVAYRFTGTSGPEPYKLWYCPECANIPCAACNPGWGAAANTLSEKIRVFSSSVTDDYLDVRATACWEPSTAADATLPSGTQDNPCVEMQNRIYMPGVSAK